MARLQHIFEDLWVASDKARERDLQLADVHRQQILPVYEPALGIDLNTQPSMQARLLLSLAMLFATLFLQLGVWYRKKAIRPARCVFMR